MEWAIREIGMARADPEAETLTTTREGSPSKGSSDTARRSVGEDSYWIGENEATRSPARVQRSRNRVDAAPESGENEMTSSDDSGHQGSCHNDEIHGGREKGTRNGGQRVGALLVPAGDACEASRPLGLV